MDTKHESEAERELRRRAKKYFDDLHFAFQFASEAMQYELYGEYVGARAEHPTEVSFLN
jgi:hypothetical protein